MRVVLQRSSARARGEQSLREAAVQIGTISPATLSRLEREEVPDIETFLRVCDWLEMAPREFLVTDETEESTRTASAH